MRRNWESKLLLMNLSAPPDLSDPMQVKEFRSAALSCLGGEWPDPPPLEGRVVDSLERADYRIEKVEYQVEPGEFVSAFLLLPKILDPFVKIPAVAIWHQHNGEYQLGKSEPAGLMGNAMHHTGIELVREGFAVLCPDALCFEERRAHLKNFELEHFTFLKYVVEGKSLAWKNILDMRRAIDYLTSRPEIDANRIGCYGHSLGSTFTWLLGPWEPRLKCLVGNCCLPTYEAMHSRHILHSFSNYIPGLHRYGDTIDLAALTAPRPFHLNFGAKDSGTPIDLVVPQLERIRTAYEAAGAAGNFSFFVDENAGHELSPSMLAVVKERLRRSLKRDSEL